MHACINTYIPKYIYTFRQTDRQIFLYAPTLIHTYTYICSMYACTKTGMMYIHIYMQIDRRIHILVRNYMDIYTHIHIYTHEGCTYLHAD